MGAGVYVSAGKYVATVAPHIENGIPVSYYAASCFSSLGGFWFVQ